MSRTVLITGCSDGGLGSALAIAFHQSGRYRVFATARNSKKLSEAQAAGIETLQLDVLSESSIKACVEQVRTLSGSLDILVNNAGSFYSVAIMDTSIEEAKKMFDLNVWSNISMIQAFMPLLLKSEKAIIVNHTSTSSKLPFAFSGVYPASKAAISMLTESLRGELSPFGIKVVEVKSGSVKSRIFENGGGDVAVSPHSLYYPARSILTPLYNGDSFKTYCIPAEPWAKSVVSKIEGSDTVYWVGGGAKTLYWSLTLLPQFILRKVFDNIVRLGDIKKAIASYGRDKVVKDVYGRAE